ncbi:hypothetical protein [Snodgrassella communis]|uniref:hypothetical protein n=1 Tax=Snodgrassella communis TaxID=2946699 RepID=UPI001EF5416B|nr:hypothetical protein [Snodgrassella communis]
MHSKNERIELSKSEAINVLSEIEYILISLRNIANYYFYSMNNKINNNNLLAYYKETTRFIDENNVTQKLADIRHIITEKFDDELGDDDMDDIEREMTKINYWEKPGD